MLPLAMFAPLQNMHAGVCSVPYARCVVHARVSSSNAWLMAGWPGASIRLFGCAWLRHRRGTRYARASTPCMGARERVRYKFAGISRRLDVHKHTCARQHTNSFTQHWLSIIFVEAAVHAEWISGFRHIQRAADRDAHDSRPPLHRGQGQRGVFGNSVLNIGVLIRNCFESNFSAIIILMTVQHNNWNPLGV